jgi:hypothetical protein
MLLRAQEGNSSDPLLEMLSSLGKSQDDDSSAKNSDDSAALLKELLEKYLNQSTLSANETNQAST